MNSGRRSVQHRPTITLPSPRSPGCLLVAVVLVGQELARHGDLDAWAEINAGIMSAIDFDMQIERLPNPKGEDATTRR
jgi:hypothetical protein